MAAQGVGSRIISLPSVEYGFGIARKISRALQPRTRSAAESAMFPVSSLHFCLPYSAANPLTLHFYAD